MVRQCKYAESVTEKISMEKIGEMPSWLWCSSWLICFFYEAGIQESLLYSEIDWLQAQV
jgi:hypothetical protein